MTQTGDNNLQVIILAAGKGTRMKSALPKVLHQLAGKSLLARVTIEARKLNPKNIVVVTGYGKELVEEEIQKLKKELDFEYINVAYQENQLGTADAVKQSLGSLTATAEHVLILPGDCPLLTQEILANFISQSESEKADLSLLTCLLKDGGNFGRVLRKTDGSVSKIVEKKDCTPAELNVREINTSIYYLELSFLKEAVNAIRNDNAQKEYYLTDIVEYGVEKNLKVSAVVTQQAISVLGANDRAELSFLERIRRAEINQAHMVNGVTLEDSENIYIDEDVKIQSDCFIGSGTKLKGATFLANGVKIDGNSLIENSRVGENTHIKFSSHLEDSIVGSNCKIGPFAHLRPATLLHNDVHLGNFVETKKTEMKSGAKANHLTYLGDAIVGEGVNVGAGTITCNYDGVNKTQTIIEERAFIGSNSCLVAPVTIGAGAYVAAGSVINKNVPPSALAVARARQENKEGWMERKSKGKK